MAIAPNVSTVTSNAFSPPAATVIQAAFATDSFPTDVNARVMSVTSSGVALAWHLKGSDNRTGNGVGGFVEVWWAHNSTKQSNITVTATFAQPTKNITPPAGCMQVIVLRNAAADQSAAAWVSNSDVTESAVRTGLRRPARSRSHNRLGRGCAGKRIG